jgi:uncharacterized YigZ family protein
LPKNKALITQTDTYFTISKPSTGIFKDKGSKFLSFAYPVKDEKEVKAIVDQLRKDYFDARHHCYAYRFGADKKTFRVNDDGEPSGTAGKPILGQIVSRDLTNILIVVVRYFGGTLLGTHGLINAYRAASQEALSNANIVQKYVYELYDLEFDYLQINHVMKIVKDFELEVINQQFEMACNMRLKIKLSLVNAIISKFTKIESLKFNNIGSE